MATWSATQGPKPIQPLVSFVTAHLWLTLPCVPACFVCLATVSYYYTTTVSSSHPAGSTLHSHSTLPAPPKAPSSAYCHWELTLARHGALFRRPFHTRHGTLACSACGVLGLWALAPPCCGPFPCRATAGLRVRGIRDGRDEREEHSQWVAVE